MSKDTSQITPAALFTDLSYRHTDSISLTAAFWGGFYSQTGIWKWRDVILKHINNLDFTVEDGFLQLLNIRKILELFSRTK